MADFRLKQTEKIRRETSKQMLKDIKQFYNNLLKEVNTKITQYSHVNKSLTKQQLTLIQRDIKIAIDKINQDLERNVIANIRIMGESVVKDTHEFLRDIGFKEKDIQGAFLYVPDHIVTNLITGQVYDKPWSLSQAIWGYNKETQQTLQNIIANGTKQGQSAYEVAKKLEQYVNPSASKRSRTIKSWRYNADGKKVKEYYYFGSADYNAQRLARTMITHAYQQSFERVNKNDPFVTGYRWLTSNFHGRVCQICRDRANQNDYGLGTGIYPKGQLPLDHPNGMCTWEAVIPDSMSQIADKIGKWYQSPTGTYPDIDRYVLDFYER